MLMGHLSILSYKCFLPLFPSSLLFFSLKKGMRCSITNILFISVVSLHLPRFSLLLPCCLFILFNTRSFRALSWRSFCYQCITASSSFYGYTVSYEFPVVHLILVRSYWQMLKLFLYADVNNASINKLILIYFYPYLSNVVGWVPRSSISGLSVGAFVILIISVKSLWGRLLFTWVPISTQSCLRGSARFQWFCIE